MRRATGLGVGAVFALVLGCGDGGGARSDGDDGLHLTDGQEDTTGGASETGTGESGGEVPGCLLDHDCGDDGVCLGGVCCGATDACGDACCGDEEMCLFGICQTPGIDCTTPDDCGAGAYCELSLGEPGGGYGEPPPGLVCTQPLPPSGKCVALPPVCGEAGADPDACVEACEFQPEAGQLDTTVKWQWGLYEADEYPQHVDVWATPTVARIYDANCDGRVDANDPPNVVFVAGDSNQTCCSCGGGAVSSCLTGILRVLDGRSGEEVWSLAHAKDGPHGFAGMSVALGDIDRDGYVDIVAMTGDGYPVVIDRHGDVVLVADAAVPNTGGSFGWGGGLAIGDMDGDGAAEIAYGRSLYTTAGGALTKLWDGGGGSGGGATQALSYMVDLDGDGTLELLAGNTAYHHDGSIAWQRPGLGDGFTAVGDLDGDGAPEVVLILNGITVLDGATGDTRIPLAALPDSSIGGPPTIADFDGDGLPEIGVAGGVTYVAYKPNMAVDALAILWQHPTKDASSARTGSSVFDFEGDGRAEVVYSDECFLRVLDGVTGELRYAAPNTTFTATEALIVADITGDQRAEIVRVSNSANWQCDTAPWNQPDPDLGRPAWEPPPNQSHYRGITVFGDAQQSWVGTRTIWNQHAYSVSNICDGQDDACAPGEGYGAIPAQVTDNWSLPWLNNFRQNVQQGGLFSAPDATVTLTAQCTSPVELRATVRNIGLAPLTAGVEVVVLLEDSGTELGVAQTTQALLPGQSEVVEIVVPEDAADASDSFVARVRQGAVGFTECRADNNESDPTKAACGPG